MKERKKLPNFGTQISTRTGPPKEAKIKVKLGAIDVKPWEVLKTILKTDLDYWKDMQAQATVNTTAPENIRDTSMAIFGSNIQLTEYYIDIMEKIEKGELGNQES